MQGSDYRGPKIAVQWLACALLALMLGGCWGPSRSLPEPRATAKEPEPPPEPVKPPVAVNRPAEPPKPPEPPKPLPVPQRPAQFADWTWDDLLSAREEHDPALPQAAQHIVRSGAKDEDTLWLLARLVEVEEPPPPPKPQAAAGDDEPRPAAPPKPTLSVASVVIPCFAALDGGLAQQTLLDLLKGRVATDVDEVQCLDLVLRSLVETPSPAHEELLGSILTDPARWRPLSSDGVTADRLHELCFKLVQPTASAALRTRLAQYIVQTSTPAAHRERIGPWLAGPEPINLGAQVVLHNSELLSAEAKARFREAFAKLNSPALDQLLGVSLAMHAPAPAGFQPFEFAPAKPVQPAGQFVNPDKAGLFTGAKPAEEEDQAAQTVRHFWSPDFVASVARDAARMNNLGTQRELMLLACNLPHQTVRAELHRALKRQWVDGTAPFEAARLTADSFRDPGFLVLVKSMPREEQKPMTPAPGAAASAAPPKPTKERQAKFAWMGAAESFVRSLNDRFYAAARAKPRETGTVSELPLALHRGLPLVAEYHLNWPAQLEGRLKGVAIDPLVLHYVRTEGEDRYQKVVDYYRNKLASPQSHNVARGQWLESQQSDSATGRVRSVDVLITRDDAPTRTVTTPENLLVEILWIEIPDPNR